MKQQTAKSDRENRMGKIAQFQWSQSVAIQVVASNLPKIVTM